MTKKRLVKAGAAALAAAVAVLVGAPAVGGCDHERPHAQGTWWG